MRDFTYSLENMIADIEAHGLVSYTHGHLDTNTRTMGFDLKLGTGACIEYRVPETQVQEALRYCREEKKVGVKQPKIEPVKYWDEAAEIKPIDYQKIEPKIGVKSFMDYAELKSFMDYAELMKLINDAPFMDLHKEIMDKQVAKFVHDEEKRLISGGKAIHSNFDKLPEWKY